MIDTLCHVLCCTTLKETIKCTVCGHRKLCSAIPACTSKLICCQPQLCESTNQERKSFQLHLMQWNPFITYEKHMIKLLRAKSCSEMKIRSFLLKTYQENHQPGVDGKAIEKENTRDQRKLEIAIPAISTYLSILICSAYTL